MHASAEADGLQHARGHLIAALDEERGALDVDGVAIAFEPLVPRTGWDRIRAASGVDARPQIGLELAHLALAAHWAVAGDDRVGEVDDRLQHVGPLGRVALER